MKKLIVIIIILASILVGMIVYKKQIIKSSTSISMQEIEKIENYINQIYMWKEITNEALPVFEDINQASETWIWEVVNKNIEEENPSYEQITEKARDIFGQALEKEFPKNGTEYLTFNDETNQYEALTIRLDDEIDLFLINNIKKIDKKRYEVEILEYLEDDSPTLKEESENFVIIKNLDEEEIGRASSSEENEETELVKRNIDKFTSKKIILKIDNEKLYVERVDK